MWQQGKHQAGMVRGEAIPADCAGNSKPLKQGGRPISMISPVMMTSDNTRGKYVQTQSHQVATNQMRLFNVKKLSAKEAS